MGETFELSTTVKRCTYCGTSRHCGCPPLSPSWSTARTGEAGLLFRLRPGGEFRVGDQWVGLALRDGHPCPAADPGGGVRSLARLADHHRAYGGDDPFHARTDQQRVLASDNAVAAQRTRVLSAELFYYEQRLLLALQTVGADRILFSLDYPFSTNEQGRAFLESVSISQADKEKISHLNAERLLKIAEA